MPAFSPRLTPTAGHTEPNVGTQAKGTAASEPHGKHPHCVCVYLCEAAVPQSTAMIF